MVQKYQSPVRVYKYPFELVMAVSTSASARAQRVAEECAANEVAMKVFLCIYVLSDDALAKRVSLQRNSLYKL